MGSVSRNIIVVAATAIFLAAATAAALTLGASSVSLPELTAWLVGGDVSDMARNILENVRVPRVLAALLAGAAFVVGCDLLARVLFAPYELPVGILLAFIGGPFFIYLILKNKGGGLD